MLQIKPELPRLVLLLLTCLALAFLLAACSSGLPAPAVVAPLAPQPSQTSLPQPVIHTPTPVTPTATPAPSLTPTTPPTSTPTLFPMSIPALRQGSYPGSDIVIEETLEPGANYSRYLASYRSEGLKIYALLTIPKGEAPPTGWPGIVFNHGYIPPEIYRTTERYIAYVDNLARSGYIVFRPDYRGNAFSEGEPRGAYGDPGYTIDVLNALASLKRLPQADPQRLGMWGHSMGGFLTLRAMVISPDIRAGVIWSGVVGSYPDLLTRWHRPGVASNEPTPPPSSRRWRSDWVSRFGDLQQNPAFWDSLSANSYLADLSGPLQLHHAEGDHEVPLEFSVNLDQQVKQAGKTVELFTYPGDNHNISENFTLAMNRTIQFYNQYLKGEQ